MRVLAFGHARIGRVLSVRVPRLVKLLATLLVSSMLLAACSSGGSSNHALAGNELRYRESPAEFVDHLPT